MQNWSGLCWFQVECASCHIINHQEGIFKNQKWDKTLMLLSVTEARLFHSCLEISLEGSTPHQAAYDFTPRLLQQAVIYSSK